MLSINWPRAYDVTCGHGAYRVDQSRRPARSAKLSILPSTHGGLFSLDGETEYPLMFASLVEGSCTPKVDAQITNTVRTMAADGFNALRLNGFTNRHYTESGTNWGVWKYVDSDASAAHRWELEEDALVQLDKTIAYALDAGIEVIWIDLEGWDDSINRHPDLRPQGTYQGRGMQWSTEFDAIRWDTIVRIFARTNTITGERYCDNGRIVWGFDNECGFSNAYQRSTTNSWGGSSSMRWFAKIINEVTDPSPVVAGLGDNGYWRTELAAKWVAWVTASSYSASVGVNGSGGTWDGCIPEPATYSSLSTDSNDKNAVIDFIGDMEVEHIGRLIAAVDAEAPRGDVVLCTGTWTYLTPRAHLAYASRGNLFSDTHNYIPDDGGVAGVKTGSVVTRRSMFDKSWTVVTYGLGLTGSLLGQRSTETGYTASEENQYGPSGWRYERTAIAAILSCRHQHPIGQGWAQQISTSQLLADGRNMSADHVNAASQCNRLISRCVSPIVRHRFFSPATGLFTINATPASVRAQEHTQGSTGFSTVVLAGGGWVGDGSEHGAWADKAVVFDIDDANTPTTDFTNFPKVTDATLNTGTYLINTADEKIHIRHDHGIQAMSPYCCWFIGEMLASPVFAMAMSISNLSAAVTRAHLCLRSDGPWPLFEGPWMMFVHGSDYSIDLVNRGSDYTDGGPGALGEAAWLADSDSQTLYYTAADQSSWSNGDISDQRLMLPESLTVEMDSSAASGVFASLEQEVFKIGNDGVPVRVATSFGSGITSFAYDATCPVYYGHPAAKRNTSVRNRR